MPAARRKFGCRIVRRALRTPFRIAGVVYDAFDTVVAEIAEGGRSGRGEGAPLGYKGQTAAQLIACMEAVKPLVEDGCDRDRLRGVMPPSGARNAMDCALWDLEAQQTGVPVWSRAGLAAPRPIRTTFTIGCDRPPAMAASALRWPEARALKLKLCGDDDDAARIAAVRAARPDAWLAVDANRSLSPSSFGALRPALSAARVALVEQPLDVGAEAAVAGLRSPVPVVADESFQTLADLDGLVGRFDGVNIKLDKCGGLTEAILIVEQARRLGLSVMVGNMGGSSLAMAPAAVIAGYCDHVDLDGPIYLEADESPPADYRGGLVAVPPALWGSRRGEPC
jgi:L-alanine-DL-glutamate epimerase-like enolase superfamily enzyme